jgi:hypothetical protein
LSYLKKRVHFFGLLLQAITGVWSYVSPRMGYTPSLKETTVSNFKVGMRVRIVKSSDSAPRVGDVGIIEAGRSSLFNFLVKFDDGEIRGYWTSELEPVTTFQPSDYEVVDALA